MTELLEPNVPGNPDDFLNMFKDGVSMENGAEQNQTISIINSIVLIQVQQHMHIALGIISMALALWVIFRIWYDSWKTSKLKVKFRPRKRDFLMALHPAESFPLALAFTTFFQTLIFIVIQSLALNTNFTPHCILESQITLPAIFALSYMHLVFGFEMTIRSLRKVPFQPRGKWANITCILGFVVLLIATWVPTQIMPEEMECYGEIISQPSRNIKTGAGISVGLTFALPTMAAIIGLQLYNTRKVDPNERIAGSRMVYYLTASAILQVFVLPFFIQGVTMTFDNQYSSLLVAEFILFTSGSFLALLHLILRANASLTAIKAKPTHWHRKRRFRLFGPSDLELITIGAPLDLIYESHPQDEKSQEAYVPKTISPQMSSTPPTLPKFSFAGKAVGSLTPQCSLTGEHLSSQNRLPVPQEVPSSSSPSSTHKRNKSGCTVFPAESAVDIRLPATTYNPQTPSAPVRRQAGPEVELKSATPMLTTTPLTDVSQASRDVDDLLPQWHPRTESFLRRSSVDSSATVQIGIRLSNATAALVSSSLDCTVDISSREEPLNPGPTNHDSRNEDSQQRLELQRPETAPGRPGEAVMLKLALTPPSSRKQCLYEPPIIPPNNDDRPAGFF